MKDIMILNNFDLLQGDIKIPALTSVFDPMERYRNNPKVKYSTFGNFVKFILNGTKPFDSIPESFVNRSALKQKTSDADIMTGSLRFILSKEEVFYRIDYFVEKEILTKDTLTIVGYLACDDKETRTICVLWNTDFNEVECYVVELGDQNEGIEFLL
jgi:hypothetical protein